MSGFETKYWPFVVLPFERRSKQQQAEVAFLETAFREEFRPNVDSMQAFCITAGNKGARILVRGRSQWEVLLGFVDRQILSAYVSNFNAATSAALDWARGEDLNAIASELKKFLVRAPKGMNSLTIADTTGVTEEER